MKVLLTGAEGFLGWHTRARLQALGGHDVLPVGRADWPNVAGLACGADVIVHVAGVNRAADAVVEQANIDLARDVADAARASGSAPRIVFANSVQAGSDSPYGIGKAVASELLAAAADDLGSAYVDVRLPNLFGEHGRPHYNSFVATFVDAVVNDHLPQLTDRPIDLLHAQGAAQALIDGLTTGEKRLDPLGTPTTVRAVYDTLRAFNDLYSAGDIPPLVSPIDLDLFNTLRSARFPAHYPIQLTLRADYRGRLVEVVRAHGGQGQTFVSTTKPGHTRGQHFHLRKVERFAVLSGTARIAVRKLFSDELVVFEVTGDDPVVVDMPTMWAHSITNTGDRELTTLFWTHELFAADAADTFPEQVGMGDRCSRS